MKYFFHVLKHFKSLVVYPKETIRWFYQDFKKDLNAKNFESKCYAIWCAGLPKSGTTLIEQIFEELPYVRLDASALRIFNIGKLDHPHGVSNDLFKGMKKKNYTFIKTHTHYDKKYEELALKNNVKIIISLRDLRDMMISRYFHIINEKNHWLNSKISGLSFKDGFITSLISKPTNDEHNSLTYYYFWIYRWLKIANKKNYLFLWYEDYNKDPLKYINKILEYTCFNDFSAEKIFEKIQIKNSNNLEKSLSQFSKLKSTFRKGEIEEWKKYFDKDISDIFNANLPGKLEDILYKE